MAIALQRARRMMFMIHVRTVVGTHLHWGETKFTFGIKIETWPFHHIASPSIQSYKHTTCRLKVNPWLKLCVWLIRIRCLPIPSLSLGALGTAVGRPASAALFHLHGGALNTKLIRKSPWGANARGCLAIAEWTAVDLCTPLSLHRPFGRVVNEYPEPSLGIHTIHGRLSRPRGADMRP